MEKSLSYVALQLSSCQKMWYLNKKAYQTSQLPYFEVKASKVLTFMINKKEDTVMLVLQCGITAVPSLPASIKTPII